MRPITIEQTEQLTQEIVHYYSQLGWQAMMAEVNLTPNQG